MPAVKTQRIRDPIHDLIVFRAQDDIDQIAWRLVNTREFQRLRRVRQLGLSELVFPGATHTRFAHCLGVFYTARRLLEVMKRKLGSDYDEARGALAAIAALLHDLGHGPFSHAFEGVEKRRGVRKTHEEWTGELLRGETEVRDVLERSKNGLSERIADLLTEREPKDIYTAVVSSQFDADRLDYIQRDRYMTGTGSGGIDFEWLLDCLEVGRITIRLPDEQDLAEVDGLYLNHKGLRAAEEYLLARYHLYSQVYMHKTTRAAEQMLGGLLTKVEKMIKARQTKELGLSDRHPLVRYYSAEPSLETYLALDDPVMLSALAQLASAKNEAVAHLASGLCNRRLYKCYNVGDIARKAGADSLPRFRRSLKERVNGLGFDSGATLFIDEARISAYGLYGFEDRGALQKVLIGDQHGGRPEDIAARSPVVRAIEEEQLFRVYVPTSGDVERLRGIWGEVNP